MTDPGQAVAMNRSDRESGVRIDVQALTRTVRTKDRRELTLLDGASFSVAPGELVAIVGGSGTGKTTLLEAMAGVTPATSGCVRFDGADLYSNLRTFRSVLGFVRQDDIIHVDLPLEHTLRYAAWLRLPPSTTDADVDAAVADAMAAVDLTVHAETRVASLSGGQRKRASIAAELLTSPQVFFLDEPTSGLDPVTSAEVVGRLRHLADCSTIVVFTTHSGEDLAVCDRIVFMAPGGRVAFVGSLDDARAHFHADSVTELYGRLASLEPSANRTGPAVVLPESGGADPGVTRRPPPNALRQWAVLTRRTMETIVRNRLTLARQHRDQGGRGRTWARRSSASTCSSGPTRTDRHRSGNLSTLDRRPPAAGGKRGPLRGYPASPPAKSCWHPRPCRKVRGGAGDSGVPRGCSQPSVKAR